MSQAGGAEPGATVDVRKVQELMESKGQKSEGGGGWRDCEEWWLEGSGLTYSQEGRGQGQQWMLRRFKS